MSSNWLYSETAHRKIAYSFLCWSIIALGFMLRLDQYLFNRSFWLDEAFFATSVVNRTILELFIAPLEYTAHVIPPGFLAIAKLTTLLFGNSDFVLRLFPFICGVIALILFYPLAKRYISAPAVPFALFFFAISDRLIYFSSEFKQYSCDVMVAIGLLLLVDHLQKTSQSATVKLLLLTIIGSITIWFSYPAVFILAILGIYLLWIAFPKKEWKWMASLIGVYAIWLANFLIFFIFIIRVDAPTNHWMRQYWVIENAFMPIPWSLDGLHWILNSFLKQFSYVGFSHTEFAFILFVFGTVALSIHKKVFLLLAPFLLTLGVSFFHQYPFSGRVLLFLTPILFLLMAEGLTKISIELPTHHQKVGVFTLISLFTVILLVPPSFKAITHWNTPRIVEETRPLFEYVQENRQESDTIYLYHWVEPTFRYYASRYGFKYEDCHLINPIPAGQEHFKEVDYFRQKLGLTPMDADKVQCILGVSENFDRAQQDLEKLRNRRVWFIFSHAAPKESSQFLAYLDRIGTRLEEDLRAGASLYLYQLGN